ncbi:MmgE/PrpD family protein [Agaricicola taiwanensis]|uniref:MmgE/PrpD family protein n=1 Tax=Agaricicola taiwanensis TaxID=591372 RepID=A0A8J2VF60_9RHOB|nr:MmgE/PrpD family protein [Agaricicola taiwanensis]GGE28174.1 MmgE/PrpD family protein [Agaricicola taiwanensis]
MDDALNSIVEFILSTSENSIPADVLEKSRDLIIDTLGCAIGGRVSRACAASRSYPALPTPEGSGAVIGEAGDYPVEIAAFWNSAASRYLDFNDLYPPIGHPSDMIGALVAASKPTRASGRRILAANAIAYEVFARLSETVLARRSMSLDYGYGICIGASAGLCHLYGLDRAATEAAIAMAATSGIQLRANRAGQLSDYKSVQTAVSAKDAVFFTLLARAGLTGPSAPFSGRHGIMELLDGKAAPLDIDSFDSWKIFGACLKYWPTTYNTQASVWAALKLRDIVSWEEIDKVTLFTSRFLHHESASEPAKWDPKTRETADHSLPYIFSRAMQHGTMNVGSYEPEAIADPQVRVLMNRLKVIVDEEIDAQWPARIGLRLEAVTKDGAVHRVESFDPLGHERNPMSAEDISRKFTTLVAPYLGADLACKALEIAWRMDELKSFNDVLKALVPQAA